MRTQRPLGLAPFLAATALFGCSGTRGTADASVDVSVDVSRVDASVDVSVDAEASVEDTPSSDAGRDAQVAGCPSAEFGGLWGRLYDQGTRAPLADVTACVANRPELSCVTTDAHGEYGFPCVPVGEAELTYEGAGHSSQRWAWSSRRGIAEEVSLGLSHQADDVAFLAPSAETFPDGARSLVHLYFLGAADDATVALRRGSGAGPFYTRYEGGTLDPALTSIMTAAESAYFVAQAADGEREIELVVTPGPTASRCAQLYGDWAPTDATPSAVRVPVAPDATSIVFVRCE